MVWYNPLSWGEDIVNAIEIPEGMRIVFDKVGSFLDAMWLLGLTFYVIFTVILFFAIVILIVYIPIWLYPVYKKNKELIDKIVKIKAL